MKQEQTNKARPIHILLLTAMIAITAFGVVGCATTDTGTAGKEAWTEASSANKVAIKKDVDQEAVDKEVDELSEEQMMKDAAAAYKRLCEECHGPDGKGNPGPAVNSAKLSRAELIDVIANGKGTMPKFKGKLTRDQLRTLVDHIESQEL